MQLRLNRVKSFSYWEKSTSVDFNALVDAGFFYTMHENVIQCMVCRCAISVVESSKDIIKIHHQLLGYNCKITSDVVKQNLHCRVCFENNLEIAFVPCGHFCVCNVCAARLVRCPICNQTYEKALRIFIP